MARTTLALEASILREMRLRAARQGTSLQQVANDLLRQALAARPPQFRLRLETWDGHLQPGLDLSDRDALFEAMEAIRD